MALSVLALTDPVDCEALAADLRILGARVQYVDNVLEAVLRKIDTGARLVVCDVDRVNWRQALDAFGPFNVPVVFLTRLGHKRMEQELLDAGAFEVVGHPCRTKELQLVLALALASRRRSRSLGGTVAVA